MAVKSPKQATQPDLVAQSAAPLITEINLEEAIADEILDNLDWSRVRSALLKKAPARLFAWLAGGNDTPVNISAYPELTTLPSSQDGKAA
jgi:hypothetical protein